MKSLTAATILALASEAGEGCFGKTPLTTTVQRSVKNVKNTDLFEQRIVTLVKFCSCSVLLNTL